MEEQIANAFSAEDIKKVFRNAMLEQNLVEADPYDPSLLHPREEAAPAARAVSAIRFGAKVTIDGKVHVAEGRTQEEADAKIAEVIRGATQHLRDDQGRFAADQGRADEAAAASIVAKADLELKFKRGEISTADFLEQSGAVGDFFAKKGIALEDVEAAAQTAAGERIHQSWAEATTEFMTTTAEGKIWPGGEANKVKLIEVLEAMGATDAPNSENLRRAAVYMRENDLFVGNPEAERDAALLAARTPEEIAAALHGERFSRPGSAATWQSRKWNGHG
jgi:hypothetical protein